MRQSHLLIFQHVSHQWTRATSNPSKRDGQAQSVALKDQTMEHPEARGETDSDSVVAILQNLVREHILTQNCTETRYPLSVIASPRPHVVLDALNSVCMQLAVMESGATKPRLQIADQRLCVNLVAVRLRPQATDESHPEAWLSELTIPGHSEHRHAYTRSRAASLL